MNKYNIMLTVLPTLIALSTHQSFADTTIDPFSTPIEADQGVVTVNYQAFATLPEDDGEAARMMLLVDEPGTERLFVNSMVGKLYSLSYDGSDVNLYLDMTEPKWQVPVQARGSERGFQSFTFHPQFGQEGTLGYGKFYTYVDTTNTEPTADFLPAGTDRRGHDTVVLEWTAKNPAAESYDGDMPRVLIRAAQPYGNHNAGHMDFNPLATPDADDFGLLYIGLADGGAGGDPLNLAQNLNSAFGKILRIDPLGNNSDNGQYGIPAGNPFVNNGDALNEIYAYGVRNPQRLAWDAKTGAMYVADIGQNAVEEVSPVVAGGNLGWNVWEGSYRYVGGQVETDDPRSEAGLIYPVVEYDHDDPLLGRTAITGLHIYRGTSVPQLSNKLIFGDNPSGEIFYVDADNLPEGGQDAVRRILFNTDAGPLTLLQLIQANSSTSRADLRMGIGNDERIFVLNKHDGIVRVIVP